MKLLKLFGATLLATFVPIPVGNQIQTTPSPSTNTVIDHVADLAQTMGAVGFVTVALAVVLVLLIIGVLLFFWKVVSPLLSAIASDRTAREEAVVAERQARVDAQTTSSTQLKISDARELEIQKLNTRHVEATEKLGGHLEALVRTMNEKDERQEQRHITSQTVINSHTDAVTDAARDAINKHIDDLVQPMREDVAALTRKVDSGVTLDQIKAALQPLQEHLDHISEKASDFIIHTGDTGKLRANIAIDAERAREQANGDTPITPSESA